MISTNFLKSQIKPLILNIHEMSYEDDLVQSVQAAVQKDCKFLLVVENDTPQGIIVLESLLGSLSELFTAKPVDFLNKDFCIVNRNGLSLQISQEIQTRYMLIYDQGKYIGIVDLRFSVDYYDTVISDVAAVINLLLDSTHNGVIALDQDRHLILMNEKALEVYDVKNDNVIGRSVSEAFPTSPLNHFLFGEPRLGFKCQVNGRYILANRTPLEMGGKILGGISVFQDITNDELATQELASVKENELYLESIIENSYDGIYITDRDGLTLMVNRSYERITGIERTQLLGRYVKELTNEGLMSISLTEHVVNEKKSITLNQTVNQKMLIITGNPIVDENGRVIKVITNVRDITELIDLEKQLHITKEMADLYKKTVFEDAGDNIVCKSKGMKQVLHLAKKVAPKNTTVLVLGETGTGKEVVSKYIHTNSDRANENYIKINCGAIPANLLESELFGYVGGAFTGANPKGKMGMFELANEGTLFLDEIGEMPIDLQASLLRVLQDGEVTRIGDTKSRKVDVRIIAATNKNLENMIDQGTFRSDLFYRLNVISIYVPPLRERVEDISAFAEYFINELNKKYNEKKIITQSFIENLKKNDWPGNVRELANFIEKQFVMSDSEILDSFTIVAQQNISSSNGDGNIIIKGLLPMQDAIQIVEETLLRRAMSKAHNTHKAAKMLNMSQPTFFRKYKEYCKDDNDNEQNES